MSNATRSGPQSEPNSGTNPTRFGNSMESKAQIEDAEIIASGTVPGEALNVYRLVAVAAPDDPRWDGVNSPQEVVVAARTAGDARIVAAGRELDFLDVDAAPAEDVTTRNASIFRDEKAYTVIEVEHGRTGLQRGVLVGQVPTDTIKPTEL